MSKSITAVIITASVLTSLSAQAAKYQKPDLSEFLEEFHQNPEQVMDQLPAKIKGEGTISIFSEEDTKDNRFVETKDQVRQKFISLPGRAGFQYNDLAKNWLMAVKTTSALSVRWMPRIFTPPSWTNPPGRMITGRLPRGSWRSLCRPRQE